MFSCIARELKRVAARSGEELMASICRSYEGVHVEWVNEVVDFWSAVSDRCITYSLSKCYSFQIKLNETGQVVHRTKDSMHGDTWFPVGRHAEDLQFAQPLLCTRTSAWTGKLSFVVPNVIDVQGLRSSCQSYSRRLHLQRSARFPDEVAGAAMAWWTNFLQVEEKKIANMCVACRSIREELGSIVIHRKKKNDLVGKAFNTAKLARREELLEMLRTHECSDRSRGVLTVPADHSPTLSAIIASWKKPMVSENGPGPDLPDRDPDAKNSMPLDDNSSASDSEGMTEDVNGLPSGMAKAISVPQAFKKRGDRITKGMVVAVHCCASNDEYMGGQAFWLAKVLRITKKHVTLHYYGDEFLKVYKLLGDDEILKYSRRDITILHWNITFVGQYKHCGGKLSKGDQRVLSLDVRVPWTLPEHSSSVLGKRKKRSAATDANTRRSKKK